MSQEGQEHHGKQRRGDGQQDNSARQMAGRAGPLGEGPREPPRPAQQPESEPEPSSQFHLSKRHQKQVPPRRVDHTYRDYSNYPPEELPSSGRRAASSNFPSKLHQILSTPDYSDIISWMPHGRAWKIHDKGLLLRDVVPLYFTQTKYESFARQLNGWGFKRLHQAGNDFGAYYHECFLRGLPQLTALMRRVAPNKGKLVPYVEGEPNFYEIGRRRPLPSRHPAMMASYGEPYPAPYVPHQGHQVAGSAAGYGAHPNYADAARYPSYQGHYPHPPHYGHHGDPHASAAYASQQPGYPPHPYYPPHQYPTQYSHPPHEPYPPHPYSPGVPHGAPPHGPYSPHPDSLGAGHGAPPGAPYGAPPGHNSPPPNTAGHARGEQEPLALPADHRGTAKREGVPMKEKMEEGSMEPYSIFKELENPAASESIGKDLGRNPTSNLCV